MASKKTVTLTGGADATVTVTGSGFVLVSNHGIAGTANPAPVFVNINAAATDGGDEMIPVMGGRPRGFPVGDHDGSIDVHLICVNANRVSVELIDDDQIPYAV